MFFVMLYKAAVFPPLGKTSEIIRKELTAIAKTDRCVVRNQAYRRGEFNIRERHNERKNESYGNGDILPERSDLNVRFKSCNGTYEQEFNRMVDNGTVSLRGLKADAKVFDELVFDVNSAYFEERGGYDYAKQFFAEAYNLAVEEAGGEQYVLSAVLHADERNKALSEQHGRDIFHYHLHVVYVPVVDKEVRWTKRCKDPSLVGTVKETVKQVSHSKKWPRYRDESGSWVNSYSLLQDRFFEHMRAAGFTDFERGERGSTVEHLTTLEYKTLKETERAATLAAEVDNEQARLDTLTEKVTVKKKEVAAINDIDAMGKPSLFGSFTVTADEMKQLKKLAKQGVTAEEKAAAAIRKRKAAERERDEAKMELAKEKAKSPSMSEHLQWFSKFITALKRAPKRLMAVIEDIMRQPPEKQEQERNTKIQRKGQDRE